MNSQFYQHFKGTIVVSDPGPLDRESVRRGGVYTYIWKLVLPKKMKICFIIAILARNSAQSCDSTQFECINGDCIPAEKKCDGKRDCRGFVASSGVWKEDLSDEDAAGCSNCSLAFLSVCPAHNWLGNNLFHQSLNPDIIWSELFREAIFSSAAILGV